MKLLCPIIIWTLLYLLIPFKIKAQLIKENFDSTTIYNAGVAEFSLSKKFEHDLIKGKSRYYDYGITFNLMSIKVRDGLFVGLNPFYDIHVINDDGYEKLGVRVFLDARNASGSGFKAGFGPVLNTSNIPGLYTKAQTGYSSEFTYYFDWDLAITGKWDKINASRFPAGDISVSDVSLGIKFAPKGFVSAIGYVLGLASMSYNALLRSQ